MKLYQSSQNKYLVFKLDTDATEVAVSQVDWDVYLPYCDKQTSALTGPEKISVPECKDIDEFISEVNKSNYINVSLVDNKFKIEDTSGLLGEEPLGVYSVPNEEKRLVLVKDGNEFWLQDYPEYDFTNRSKVLFFRGGSSVDYLNDVRISGTKTLSRFAETQSLLLGSNTSTPDNRYNSKKSTSELVVSQRGLLQGDEFTLVPDARLIYPTLQVGDSIVLSVIGKNNGLLLQSPFFGFVDPLHIKKKEGILKTCACGFVLRAFKLYENVAIELVTDIPNNVKALRFTKVASGKVEINAIKKNDTEILCYRTPVLSTASKFVIADNQRTVESFEIPTLFQKTVLTNRNGCFVAAFRTPNVSSFYLVTSPKFEVYVTNNVLYVNSVSTGLACTANKNYIITVEKTADLIVELYEVGVGTTTFSQVGSSFSHSATQDADVTWVSGMEVGSWGMSSQIEDVDKMLQVVRAETEGVPNFSNLGTLTDGNFANFSATYANGILTKSGVEYTRQPFKVSKQLQKILRLNSREVTKTVTSSRKCYFDRIQGLYIYGSDAEIDGYNGSNLIGIVDKQEKVLNEHFHTVRGKQLKLYYEIIDSQTKKAIQCKHLKNETWSVTLAVQ